MKLEVESPMGEHPSYTIPYTLCNFSGFTSPAGVGGPCAPPPSHLIAIQLTSPGAHLQGPDQILSFRFGDEVVARWRSEKVKVTLLWTGRGPNDEGRNNAHDNNNNE